MKNEIQSIIHRIKNVNSGDPWFGRAAYEILEEVDPKKASKRPNGREHSLLDLLYHMITWADFTLTRIQKDKINDMSFFENLDWRNIDPVVNSWEKGLSEFKSIHENIIAELEAKDDAFLEEKVDYRKYNFRFL